MNNQNKVNLNIEPEEAAVIAGAIAGYLGNNKFVIKSIKTVDTKKPGKPENKIKNMFSFMTWRVKN